MSSAQLLPAAMSSAQILPAADLLDQPDEEVGSVMAEAGYSLEDSDILYSGLDGEQISDPVPDEAQLLGDSDVIMVEAPPAIVPSKKGQSGSSKKKR
jgi:hypothetical protein